MQKHSLTRNVTIRITHDEWERITVHAKRTRRSVSAALSVLILDHLPKVTRCGADVGTDGRCSVCGSGEIDERGYCLAWVDVQPGGVQATST